MSWMKENYHIAALGGGVLVLAGLGYLGYSGNQTVNEAFTIPNPPGGQKIEADGLPLATSTLERITSADPIKVSKLPSERPVNLFTSVDLFIKAEDDSKLLDIIKIKPVHPPIPNQWWVDHRIDPTYSDSPQMDQDGDGYTNLEEFEAKTDPNDPKSVGDLIEKLEVVKIESDNWRLLFKTNIGQGRYQFDHLFIPYGGRVARNRIPAVKSVEIGGVFYDGEPGSARFKLLAVESRPAPGPIGTRDETRLLGA